MGNSDAGEANDLADLNEILSPEAPRPPIELWVLVNGPDNLYGADVAATRIRNTAYKAGPNFAWEQFDYLEALMLQRIEMYLLRDPYDTMVLRFAAALDERYPRSRGRIGRAFQTYAISLSMNY